ncbi:hypothetical protein Moror_9049 [Moniliophthora roreri MCA 2997]|uniref:N-acetyltransferase ECO1 n=2 Tax=Moniliophthora roreri TaxID=221103 RepID=V2X193_MONRO|nr:hypothetical protein Moror_9049 [Moniliophthora roreri MCA 2997]KAI3607350.1 hypothetical protein WG66_005166 [Moniliophthora roreri]
MSSKVKRTYGSRASRAPFPPSSPIYSASTSSVLSSGTKRPLITTDNRPTKKARLNKDKDKPKQKTLTQLHFCIDQPVLRICSLCGMSYTKGAEDDESLHRTHCARIRKSMEWSKEEEKDKDKEGVVEIDIAVQLKGGNKGRIICIKADAGGRIGSKLKALYDMMNTTLSAPSLPPNILKRSKTYLFLLPAPSALGVKEQIVGCVVAQQISTAMEIAPSKSTSRSSEQDSNSSIPRQQLVMVDSSSGIFCYPTPLPTPLGITRIFVSPAHRRQGAATKLLSAAARTFVHGCALDPRSGQVAFSQTTGDGLALMHGWGGGGVRIYDEDQE